MQDAQNKPVLIIGGNGKTGRRVADRLQAQGREVRTVSRSTPLPFDWNDRTTWAAALQGVGAAYITYQPDLAVPGAVDAIKHFVDLALAADVRRLVLLSGRGEAEAQRAEQVLQASGADWTVVRAGWFSQNFSENFLMEGVLAGEVVMPAISAKEPFIDADDIAEVVVEALTNDRHIGQLYEVTGSRLMTFADAVSEVAAASGRDIKFVEVTADDYREMLEAHDLPEDMVWLIMYLFTNVMDGRNEYVSDGVHQALNRAPRDFADYARDVAATGAWAA
jgi:uncharacterized protein YbjT (DUF2867 family)